MHISRRSNLYRTNEAQRHCQSQDLYSNYHRQVTSLGDSCMPWPSITCRDLGRKNCIKNVQVTSTQLEEPQQSAFTPSDSVGYIISHSPEKSFCLNCNQAFTGSLRNRISNFNRHVQSVHHQGSPLKCTVCGLVCWRSDNLKKHYKNAHNIEYPPSDVNQDQAAHHESLDADTDNPSHVSWYQETPDESLDTNTDNQETFLLP